LGLYVHEDVGKIFAESMYTMGDPPGTPINSATASLAADTAELAAFFQQTPGVTQGEQTTGGAASAQYTPVGLGSQSVFAPWIYPPPGWQSFMQVGVIPTPLNDGLDHIVPLIGSSTNGGLLTPDGFYGIINKVSLNYTGPGFVQGSGDITWRILRDLQAVKNYNAITSEMGTPQQRLPIDGIPMIPGQNFQVVVRIAPAAAIPIAGTFIDVWLGGYFYPRQFGAPE
jgi:hypothetical protein